MGKSAARQWEVIFALKAAAFWRKELGLAEECRSLRDVSWHVHKAKVGIGYEFSRKEARRYLATEGRRLSAEGRISFPTNPKKSTPSSNRTKVSRSVSFYESREWRAIRYEALKRCGRKCLVCGRGPSHGIVLHVDHIKPRSLFPHLELELSNLQVLCEDCNLGKSNRDSIDWREAPSTLN